MATATQNTIQDLVSLWRRELHSFLDYLVEWSTPVSIDDVDRRLMEAFTEFHRSEAALKARVLEQLRRAGIRPDAPPWPMNASTYNYMRPRALADVFLRIARKDQGELSQLRAPYEGAEGLEERLLRYLLDEFVKARVDAIAKIEGILGVKAAAAKTEAAVVDAPPAEVEAAPAAPAKDGPPWHDESLALEERMELAKGKGLFENLFAAMAQTDCTACGYDCEGYARAIADGEDKDLSKCAPGMDETRKVLEKLMGKR